AATVSPPSPFLFRSSSAAQASSLLAELVADRTFALDARALAARVLLRPPTHPGETPYVGIVADRVHRPDAGTWPVPRAATPAEAAVAVREALVRAVDRALEGVKRVAVMTGGGVDSSALLALAVERARRVGGSAFGVALDFEGPGDDRPHRSALARYLGCEILCVRPEDAAHRFGLLWSGVDGVPLTWPGGPMEIEMLARARAHGADCALMGVGADELFDGEPRALADLVRGGDVAGALSSARALRGFAETRRPALRWLARPLLASLIPLAIRRRRALRTADVIPEWAGPRLRQYARGWRVQEIERSLNGLRTPRERFERFDASPSHEHLAWLRHQEQVASGLERRDPYLDRDLVRIVTALPPAWLLHGDTRRGLFREAVRGLIPESIRLREDKASFEPAFARFVEASGGFGAFRDVARVPELAALGLVTPAPFHRAFEAFCARPEDGWSDVWPALTVESFLETRADRRA
ncbi:MAG TPA: asparagine synthase C-terminal domain-containing protein, partial [Labilithrix sp.]|nr:asparagine synthase C-terminal domain-containing protein [Labilithrix sp.]